MNLFTPRLSPEEKEEKAAWKAERLEKQIEKRGGQERRAKDGTKTRIIMPAPEPYIKVPTEEGAKKVLARATSDHYVIPTLGSSEPPRMTINEGVAREIMNSTNARPIKKLGETINKALERKNRSSSNRRHSLSDESDATEVPPDYNAVPRPRSHSRESRSSTPQGIRGDEDYERRAPNRGDSDEDTVKRPYLQLEDATIRDDGKSVSGSTRDDSKSGSRHKRKSRSHQSDQKVQKHREEIERPTSPTDSDATFRTARSGATTATKRSTGDRHSTRPPSPTGSNASFLTARSEATTATKRSTGHRRSTRELSPARSHRTRTSTSNKERKDPRSTRESSPTPSTTSTASTATNITKRSSKVSSSSRNKSSREPTEAEIALEEAKDKLRDAKKAFKSNENDKTRKKLRACQDQVAEAEQQLAQEQVGAIAQMSIREEEDSTDDMVPVSPSEASFHSEKSRDSSSRAKRPPSSVITSASLAPSEWDRASPDELKKQLDKAEAKLKKAKDKLSKDKNNETLKANVKYAKKEVRRAQRYLGIEDEEASKR